MTSAQTKKLRILLITQGVSRVVEPLAGSAHTLVGLLESAPRGLGKGVPLSFRARAGSALLSRMHGRLQGLSLYAKNRNIPYRLMRSSEDPGLREWVRSLNPDVIVVFGMSQLLKETLFSIPVLGAINLHTAYLPEYRGPNPDFWHYYDMKMDPGVTVHYIQRGEDTGDIIFQERIAIALGMKSPARHDMLVSQTGVRLLLRALEALQAGNAPRIAQPDVSPTRRARNIEPGEHTQLIDWQTWPIERIWHVLRGTELWLNALTQPQGIYRGQRWVIEHYELAENGPRLPGRIYKEDGTYFVACKQGRIYLSRRFSVKKMLLGLLRGA